MTPTNYDENDRPTVQDWDTSTLLVEKGGIYSLETQTVPGTYIINRDTTWNRPRKYNTFVETCLSNHSPGFTNSIDSDDFIMAMWRTHSRAFTRWCYGYNTTTTFFNAEHQIWNLRRLENLLTRTFRSNPIPGINRSVLLLSGLTSFFSWHVEDELLPAVNFLHWGQPKVWYIVHPPFTQAFETLLKRAYGIDSDIGPCTNPFELKIWLTDPMFLENNHIGYSRVS